MEQASARATPRFPRTQGPRPKPESGPAKPATSPLSLGRALAVHGFELVYQAFNHLEPHGPEMRFRGIKPERLQKFLVMFGAARSQHVEIALGEAGVGLLVNRIERVHQAVAEGIGVDVERRMNEVRDVTPERLVFRPQLDRGTEALALHVHPNLTEPLARQLALAPLDMDPALEAVEGDLPDHGVEHVLDLRCEQRSTL